MAFVALGLPDGLLGVAWPSIRESFALPLEALGSLLVPFTLGYVLSSFASGAILGRMTVGALLAASCAATGASLLGYAFAPLFGVIVACAALGGLGAGAIDAAVNAYVAAHHGPRTLNWMHAAYGLGAASGPLIMTAVLGGGRPWQVGYGIVAIGQLILATGFVASRAAWPKPRRGAAGNGVRASESILRTLGARSVWIGIAAFFVYTGLEAVGGIWAYSYLTAERGLSMAAAGLAVTLYWANLTVGRVLFGFVVRRRTLAAMVRQSLLGAFAAATLLCLSSSAALGIVGFAFLGLACGPVFPSLMSGTPGRVGDDHADNAIGFQVAAAALGQSLLPTLVGIWARHSGLSVVAPALLIAALVLVALYERIRALALAAEPDREASAPLAARGGASP
jgi:fucose permease